MTCRRSPAVVAGLLGVATLGMPSLALAEGSATPLDALYGINLSSIDPQTAGALGVSFAGGVLVTLGTYALASALGPGRRFCPGLGREARGCVGQ